ncbi:MAG: hypothetical protein J6Q05_04620, partial [Elusimicrobiaceae bacterium]|nr:hypothetical protein [Elusimicrobiaceae bacterium]
ELSFTRHTQLPPDLPAQLLAAYGPENVRFLSAKNNYGLQLLCTQKTDPLEFTRQALLFLNGLFVPQK